MLKRILATTALCIIHGRMQTSPNALDNLLADAFRLQRRSISDDVFRRRLDQFFAATTPEWLKEEIGFEDKAARLAHPTAYKVDVSSLAEDKDAGSASRFSIWRRRFGLLRHLGVRCDVLVLRRGQQIPPHGHYRVVSSFYVLEGEVAYRHYDRVREENGNLFVRKTVDEVNVAGGYSTNSEFVNNIHWLAGVAPVSYLFRFTVTGVPGKTFGGEKDASERVYVDPTGPEDKNGLIQARYVSEADAKKLKILMPTEVASAS